MSTIQTHMFITKITFCFKNDEHDYLKEGRCTTLIINY